jgi:hypothetical protein
VPSVVLVRSAGQDKSASSAVSWPGGLRNFSGIQEAHGLPEGRPRSEGGPQRRTAPSGPLNNKCSAKAVSATSGTT